MVISLGLFSERQASNDDQDVAQQSSGPSRGGFMPARFLLVVVDRLGELAQSRATEIAVET